MPPPPMSKRPGQLGDLEFCRDMRRIYAIERQTGFNLNPFNTSNWQMPCAFKEGFLILSASIGGQKDDDGESSGRR